MGLWTAKVNAETDRTAALREASCMASEEVHQRRREAGHPRLEEMTVYQVHQVPKSTWFFIVQHQLIWVLRVCWPHTTLWYLLVYFFSHLFQASLWIPFTPGHRGFSSSRASWSREGHWEDQRDRADRHRERRTKRSKRSKRSKTEGKRWKPRSITFGGIAAGIAACSAAFGHVLGNGFGLGWAPGSIISLSKVVMTLSWTLCMQDLEVIQGPNRSATSFIAKRTKWTVLFTILQLPLLSSGSLVSPLRSCAALSLLHNFADTQNELSNNRPAVPPTFDSFALRVWTSRRSCMRRRNTRKRETLWKKEGNEETGWKKCTQLKNQAICQKKEQASVEA